MEEKIGQAQSSEILASIPDVDAVDTIPISGGCPGRSDGRLLGQGLSAKLLFAGGMFLLLAAVVPFMFTRKGNPKPADDAPPPWHPAATTPAGDAATPWTGAVAQTPKAQAEGTGQLPADASTSPAPSGIARTEADGRLRVIPPPDAKAPNSPDAIQPAAASPGRGNERLYPETQARPNQPMTVGDPSTDYRSSGSPGLAERRIADPPPPSEAAAERYPTERYPAERYPTERYPAERYTANPATAGWSPPAAPGVARLEGTIEKAPVRTTYDRARPSVY